MTDGNDRAADERGGASPGAGVEDLGALLRLAVNLVQARAAHQGVTIDLEAAPGLSLDPLGRDDLILALARAIEVGLDSLAGQRIANRLLVRGDRAEAGKLRVQVMAAGRSLASDLVLRWLHLAPCEDLRREHGGGFSYECEEGRLCTVTLYVGEAGRPVAEAPKSRTEPVSTDVRRILVIDDFEDLTQQLEFVLAERGYSVDVATNGYEGLTKLRKVDYDVVLLDLKMPIVDGPLLIRAVTSEMPHIIERLIVVSGWIGEYQQFLDEKKIPCLRKPFLPDALFQQIESKLKELSAKRGA